MIAISKVIKSTFVFIISKYLKLKLIAKSEGKFNKAY